MEVRFYATLRQVVGARSLSLEPQGATVKDVLDQLIAEHPALAAHLLDEAGAVRPSVAIILNGRDIRHVGGVAASVQPDSQFDIFPPVAGGAEPRPAGAGVG